MFYWQPSMEESDRTSLSEPPLPGTTKAIGAVDAVAQMIATGATAEELLRPRLGSPMTNR